MISLLSEYSGAAERVGGVVAIIFLWLLIYLVGRVVIKRAAVPKLTLSDTAAARAATTRSLLLSAWKYVAILIALIGLLSTLRPTVVTAAALTGVVGLVIAFGAQTLFKDVLAGFSILLEGQFSVGDRVKLFGVDVIGTVEGVGLRTTTVTEDDGSRVFVPNGSITAVRTINVPVPKLRATTKEVPPSETPPRGPSRRRRPRRIKPAVPAESTEAKRDQPSDSPWSIE